MSNLEYALEYTKLGFKVFPVVPNSKNPLTPHGHKDATYDEDQIRQWWAQYPNANIGLPVGEESGLCVLDVDPRNKGFESLARLQEKYGPLPRTVKVLTGGGGYHYYFKYDKRFNIPKEFKQGSDVKKSGYVIAPPSIHQSGKAYEWEFLHGLEETPISNLPVWLLCNDSIQFEELVSKTDFSVLLDGVDEGSRNNAMASLVGSLISRDFSKAECLKTALMVNQQNRPPMEDKEVECVVDSIWLKHIQEAFSTGSNKQIVLPEEFFDFMSREIPPVEFFISQLVQKCGRTLISAHTNVGKSMMAQNLVMALASGAEVLGIQNIIKANVLYLDFEMGEREMKKRLQKMRGIGEVEKGRLFLKSVLGKNILEPDVQTMFASWIEQLEIEVIVIDPISSAWIGDENNRSDVSKITSFFDSLIDRFEVSFVVVHHWRKSSRDQSGGGEMAAGSYKWTAWPEIHVTLKGDADNLIVECQKARSFKKFHPFRVTLNEENFKFEYAGDCTKKFNNETLMKVFEACGSGRIAMPILIKKAHELGQGSEEIIRKLVKESSTLIVDSAQKTHYVLLKELTDCAN